MYKIAAENLQALFQKIAADQDLYLPVKVSDQVNFRAWSQDAEVCLDTLKTVKSPKDAFFPQSENLYTCEKEGKNITIEPQALQEKNFVVFGMKACDVQGVKVLDNVFLSDPVDTFYAARREHGTIVALACHEPEESCFCKVFGIDCADPVADVAAWMIEGELYWKPLTEKGEALTKAVAELLNDADEASQKIIDLEFAMRQKVSDYRKRISVTSPKGFAMSKSMRTDFDTYLNEFKILEQTVFKNINENIDQLIDDYTAQLNLEISKRKRLEQAVELISAEALSLNKKKKSETNDVVSDVSRKIKDLTNELIIDLDNQIRSVKDQFKLLATDKADNFDLVTERKRMEAEIESISSRNTDVMERIIRQFESFYVEKNEDGQIITNDQIAEAASEELEELRERLQSDVELSQLGLAVGILHHEFNGTVNSIRHSLKDLKAWSDVDIKLEGIYKNIKVNFEHLDGYLNLFTPLNRRLNRRREDISLLDIKTFLIDLFKSRLERHNIAFKHTNGFAGRKIHGFRSTFYPVFVNIIDNAIYWLKQSDVPEKVIRLHADDTGIYISNNGIEIKPQDKERIFELRFSRKPNGRGLGLSISKEVLNAENYDIFVAQPKEGSTVTFKIQKMQ